MPNEKGYEENTGWYPIQVVSPRQVQPALEGNDRKEDTEDKKPRQTPNHGDKNSERPCPLGDSCTAPFSKIITEYISFMLDSIASFSYNQPEEEQHDTMQPMSLANIHGIFLGSTASGLDRFWQDLTPLFCWYASRIGLALQAYQSWRYHYWLPFVVTIAPLAILFIIGSMDPAKF